MDFTENMLTCKMCKGTKFYLLKDVYSSPKFDEAVCADCRFGIKIKVRDVDTRKT